MPCVVQCVPVGLLNHPGAIPIGCFHHLSKRYAIYGCGLLCLDNFDIFFLLHSSLFFGICHRSKVLKVTSLELS